MHRCVVTGTESVNSHALRKPSQARARRAALLLSLTTRAHPEVYRLTIDPVN